MTVFDEGPGGPFDDERAHRRRERVAVLIWWLISILWLVVCVTCILTKGVYR